MRVAACRAIAALFFLASALYGLVAFSPFGYELFVKPHAITWVVWCLTYYEALALGAFSVTLLALTADLERRSTRALAFAFMGVGATLVGWLFYRHVLDSLTSDAGSLVVVGVALIGALWLAVIDHLACWASVFGLSQPDVPSAHPHDSSRTFAAAAATTLFVVALYAGLAGIRPSGPGALGGPSLTAVGRSLLLHALMFGGTAWLLAAATGLAQLSRRPRVFEYLAGLGLLALAAFVVMRLLVFRAIDLTGWAGSFAAVVFAGTFAASWSGMALRLAASGSADQSGLDLVMRPAMPWRSRRAAVVALPVVCAAAYASLVGADRMEWPGLLQIVCVLAVWLSAWAGMLRITRDARRPSERVAFAGSLIVLATYLAVFLADSASGGRGLRLQLFDRYAALDPSFSLLEDISRHRPLVTTTLQHFTRANSNVAESIEIRPTSIDFAPNLHAAPGRPPNIYLFAIDSLRPDYLSAYNPAVTFTPAIGALARDSLVFRNAFSRYGGTGLSVPAIWAGGMVPHRSYVTPFAPMNALKKLLDVNGYRVMTSFDSIMVRLLPRTPGIVELAADSWTARDDACRVLADLRDARHQARADGVPVFAYSLPQNVHLSYVQGHPLNEDHPGFYSLLAARVHQVDRCLGEFIADLKADGSYDDSVIVITADHGDAIGEEGRWGHGFAGFPEVFRIPMIVHLPPRLASHVAADLDAVSFSTDLVPTLYRLLGQEASLRGPIFGTPLVFPTGTAPPRDRRRGAFLLAASYGPVYGMLQRNGESLYVYDAINTRDYAYQLSPGAAAVRVRLTGAERAANQRLIRDQIDQIAAQFHFDAQPFP